MKETGETIIQMRMSNGQIHHKTENIMKTMALIQVSYVKSWWSQDDTGLLGQCAGGELVTSHPRLSQALGQWGQSTKWALTNKCLKQAVLTPPKSISFSNNVQDPFSTAISYRDIWNLSEISYELPIFVSTVHLIRTAKKKKKKNTKKENLVASNGLVVLTYSKSPL